MNHFKASFLQEAGLFFAFLGDMYSNEEKPVVALIQSNPDVAYEIRAALENLGFQVVSYTPRDFLRRHQAELVSLIQSSHADAIVYDITTPYFENWETFQDVREQCHMTGSPYLITTVDKNLLQNVTSEAPYFEIRGKQFDHSLFTDVFRKIWEFRGQVGLKRGSLLGMDDLPKQNVS